MGGYGGRATGAPPPDPRVGWHGGSAPGPGGAAASRRSLRPRVPGVPGTPAAGSHPTPPLPEAPGRGGFVPRQVRPGPRGRGCGSFAPAARPPAPPGRVARGFPPRGPGRGGFVPRQVRPGPRGPGAGASPRPRGATALRGSFGSQGACPETRHLRATEPEGGGVGWWLRTGGLVARRLRAAAGAPRAPGRGGLTRGLAFAAASVSSGKLKGPAPPGGPGLSGGGYALRRRNVRDRPSSVNGVP